MGGRSRPNLGRSIAVWIKIGYYEITSLITLSIVSWIAALPLVTSGAVIFALFDVIGDIYCGTAPNSERERLRRFGRSLQTNFIQGLPLSIVLIFIFINTYMYFAIGWFGRDFYYLLGGLVGFYLCLLVITFTSRLVNIVLYEGEKWRNAFRSIWRTWMKDIDYTVLQFIMSALVLLISFVFFPAVFLLLPGFLTLLELIFYEELNGENPQKRLVRYKMDA